MRTVVGVVVFVVAGALAFTLAFGESPLTRLLPDPAPFSPEPTAVTTKVDAAASPLQAASTATATAVETIGKPAPVYAFDGDACPLGGH